MNRITNAMVEYFGRVPDQLRQRAWLVWLSFLAITVFCFIGIGRGSFDTSVEGWFEKDDAALVALDWFHHEFGSDDHLYIAYKAKDGDVFSENSLRTLQAMQAEITGRMAHLTANDPSALKHIVRITSLINAPVLRAEQDVLISRKLVGDHIPTSAAESERIRQIALSQKPFPQFYFSKDYRYGGLQIETDFGTIPVGGAASNTDVTSVSLDADVTLPSEQKRPEFQPTNTADYIALMSEIKTVLNKPQYVDQFEFYPVGNVATMEYSLAMAKEMGLLNVAMLVIIVALLWFLFRSLSAVVWPIVIVVMSVIWMAGLSGWLGLPITSFIMVAVMLTLAVGIADTVHVISEYLTARKEGHDHRSALRSGFRHVATACLLTTITNVVAVLALNITPIVPIQVFAIQCALGVTLPFVFSVYLLPLMLDLWAPKLGEEHKPSRIGRALPDVSRLLQRVLAGVLPMVAKRPAAFIVPFVAVFAACIYGATLTKVDTDAIASLPKNAPIREAVRIVDGSMAGAQNMEIFIDLGQVNAFHDPFVLKTLDDLQRTIERKYGDLVVRTTSLVDTVKASYKTLNEGREEMYIIPDTEQTVSQTLFLFNQSNPEDRRKLVSDNYDKSHISVRLYNRGSHEYATTWDAMRKDIDAAVQQLKQKYPDARVDITGMLSLLMQAANYLSHSELTSFGLALVFVSALLLVLFGSVKAGTIALVPNLIPALLGYGALGIMNVPLDITTLMIAPIIIGIAVDDTVHFVTRYRNEVSIDGDIYRALHATIESVGQSIVFTTLILGLGFGIMALADNTSTANLGIFGFLAIVVGLLNDLFLLPAMILMFKLRFHQPAAGSAPFVEATQSQWRQA